MKNVRVWDLPLRLFHWLLVLAVVAAFIAVNAGAMPWHGRAGLAVLGLLAFRLAWGLIGSTHARFRDFLPTPRALRDYLAGRWRGEGHNPLGALSVLAMLALLLSQAVTGLFASDDILFRGPLAQLVGNDTVETLTGVHRLQASLLFVLVLLHLGAIGWYQRVKKQDLLRPMLTGRRASDDGQARDATGGGPLAFVLALVFALAMVWLASGAWIPSPPPPPPPPAW